MNRFKRSVRYAVLFVFMIACSFSGIASAGAADRQQPQPVSVEQLVKKQSLRVSETAGQKPNVTGSVQKGKKKIEKGAVQIVGGSESVEQYYEAEIKNGIFSLYLPDGFYNVEGYWDHTGMFISCNYSFTVVKGKSNPSPLKIVIPADNVKGNIQKAGKKVASGFLFISNESGEEEDSYFTQIKNGQFNLYLPDGSYVVDGYIDDTGALVSVNYSFTVVKGKSNPSPLKITIPADNVKGSIQKAGKKVDFGFLFISNEGSKEDSYFVEIKNGQFSLYLPDGSYIVEGYTNDEGIFVPLNYSFTVAKGKSSPSPLKIKVPADNVKGSVQKDGKKVASGTVVIRDINSKEEDAYFAEIKNGQFSLYLLDGTYEVVQYIDPISEEETPLKYAFTVAKGKSNPSVLKVDLPGAK